MAETTDKLTSKNILAVALGLFLFALGFFLLNLVGRNPEGILGLFAPLTILAGIVITTVGFIIK